MHPAACHIEKVGTALFLRETNSEWGWWGLDSEGLKEERKVWMTRYYAGESTE